MTKIIDGRKAEITNAGKLYTTYNTFAKEHGYPEAAAVSDWRDNRKKPLDGDIVTLLTSGSHLAQRGVTLWIVEAANGERHIISDTGLRILEAEIAEDPAPITVLPDESLGGTLREYREVKRKASVGERVKSLVDNPPVFTVTQADNETGAIFGGADGLATYLKNYVVLEPTEVLVIDNVRYTMVDRKAAVGERVIVTEDRAYFRAGQTFVVERADYGSPAVGNGRGNVLEAYYRVLEPLTAADSTPLSSLPLADQYAENITVLTRKIAELESRVLALETDSAVSVVKVAEGHVVGGLPSFMKSAQQIRDEIVERAKADVSNPFKFRGTKVPGDPDGISFWPEGSPSKMHEVTYVINREKRTVVALIRCISDGFTVRGIAKCAPGETFNSAIGKAIALYRALGLEVPAEYLNAPSPEEVRVGDIVKLPYTKAIRTVASVSESHVTYTNGKCNSRHIPVVIDDSREDGGNSAASSALKGAA